MNSHLPVSFSCHFTRENPSPANQEGKAAPVLDGPECATSDSAGSACARGKRRSKGLVGFLPAYFINGRGDVESASQSGHVAPADDTETHYVDGETLFRPDQLSETEAFKRLRRALTESGQLVVRTADGLMTAWFAGIGAHDSLFVELRPREIWVDHDELVMGAMSSLADAQRLLRSLYRGISSHELSATGAL